MTMNDPTAPVRNLDRLRSEGDLNLSPHRRAWAAENISAATRRLLEEDARYFLHQSLSTPCLNALKSCRDAWIEDVEARRCTWRRALSAWRARSDQLSLSWRKTSSSDAKCSRPT